LVTATEWDTHPQRPGCSPYKIGFRSKEREFFALGGTPCLILLSFIRERLWPRGTSATPRFRQKASPRRLCDDQPPYRCAIGKGPRRLVPRLTRGERKARPTGPAA